MPKTKKRDTKVGLGIEKLVHGVPEIRFESTRSRLKNDFKKP